MRIEQGIKEFLTFLKSPTFRYKEDQPLDFSLVTTLFFLVFMFEMLLFIPVGSLIGLEDVPHAMEDLLSNSSVLLVISLAVISAPLAEELLFRYHLRYGSYSLLYLGIVGVGYFILISSYFMPSLGMSFSLESLSATMVARWYYTPLLLIFLFGLFFIMNQFERQSEHRFIQKIFPFLFYLSALVFALVHLSNFQIGPERWVIAPLFVLPQFILGLYLGYVRIRNNIFYSIYIHALNNLIPIILFLAADKVI